MANIGAAANGDFSVGATWTGGVVPASGDIAYANGFTVTIGDTRTVQAVSNSSASGITVGGSFSILNGCNLACTNPNGIVQGNLSTSCIITPSLTTGNSATITANCQHTVAATQAAVLFSTTGTLNFIGNITGSSGANASTVSITGIGTFNQTGNLLGGVGGANAAGINVSAAATVNITGSCTGTTGTGLLMSNGNVTVTGSVTGGSGTSGFGINNTSTSGTLTVNGPIQSGTGAPGVTSNSSSSINRLSGPFLLGTSGNINPVTCISWRWAPTTIPTYYEVPTSGGSTKRLLYTADNMPSGGYPTQNNVRSSIVYGPSNEFTGTLAVPSPSSVALNVPTDNTVGTAILTEANVRAAIGLTSANIETILANKATVDQVASIVQGATSA